MPSALATAGVRGSSQVMPLPREPVLPFFPLNGIGLIADASICPCPLSF